MNKSEIEKCIAQYGTDLYSFCCYLTYNKIEADDLYQDTFVKVMELGGIDPSKNPKSFLLSVAVRLWKNKKRKQDRRKRIMASDCMEDLEKTEVLYDKDQMPEEKLLQKEKEKRVRDVEGYSPTMYNAYLFNGGSTYFAKDGVLYWLLETDNVEIFAKHTIYLGITKGLDSVSEAYHYKKDTGKLERNTTYKGVNALFQLPIDASKGSEKAVKQYLDSLEEEDTSDTPTETRLDNLVKKLTQKNIDEYCTLIKSSVQTLTPDKDGYITWNWDVEDISSGEAKMLVEHDEVGKLYVMGYSERHVETYVINKDGTVTVAMYKIK